MRILILLTLFLELSKSIIVFRDKENIEVVSLGEYNSKNKINNINIRIFTYLCGIIISALGGIFVAFLFIHGFKARISLSFMPVV